MTTAEMTPADIRACTCGDNGNGSGWGGDWGAWIILFFIFAMFGWGGFGGGFGFGGFGGGNGMNGILTRGELCMDMNFQDVKNGVSSNGAAIANGFANLNSTICHQQYDTAQMLNTMNISNLQTANAQNIAQLQSTNAIQTQLAECCCDAQQTMAGINYNLSTQSCDTRNTIQNGVRDIIDNQNCNTRAILDKMCQQEIAAKDAQIAAQNQQIFGLQLAASQEKQNNYIVNALRQFPVASYQVPNPFTGCYGYNGYGNGNCACGF